MRKTDKTKNQSMRHIKDEPACAAQPNTAAPGEIEGEAAVGAWPGILTDLEGRASRDQGSSSPEQSNS